MWLENPVFWKETNNAGMAREVHMPISFKRLGFKATAQLSLMPVRNVYVQPFIILSLNPCGFPLCTQVRNHFLQSA